MLNYLAQLTLPNAPDGVPMDGNIIEGENSLFSTIINFLLSLVAGIAVIMIIIGGIRYIISNGDQNAVTGAKNTILYAIVGLVIAIFGFAIVSFVNSTVTDTGAVLNLLG